MESMKSRLALCTASIVISAGAASANPVTFGFEEYTGTPFTFPGQYTSLNYVKNGVTLDISRTSGTAFDINDFGNAQRPATWGSKALAPFFDPVIDDWFVVNITAPGTVTSISAQYGDYGQDEGDVRFQVWSGANGTGSLLSDQSQYWNGNIQLGTFGTFAYAGAGIGSILFKGELPTFPNSLYWDNIQVGYESVIIPLPSAGLLAGMGLLVIPLSRRRGRIR